MKKIDLTPIYESLLRGLQDRSLVDADGKLPPERDLARLYGLARNTLRPTWKPAVDYLPYRLITG